MALGIVYGDIGASPLYALRECFAGGAAGVPSMGHVYGVLSLIFWSLMLVISLKYLVLRADNHGEGGVLALALLAAERVPERPLSRFLLMGLFGAGLLYGDGLITPAILVLSAVEGLQVAWPAPDHWVLPITVATLIVLFLIQPFGTARIGGLFGPVMLAWFGVLAVRGLRGIALHPDVLWALSPHHAVRFLVVGGWPAVLVLGIVFLVVTGGEAL